MTKLLDKICKLRDLLQDKKNYKKLLYQRKLFQDLFNELPRQMKKKATDYNYELEFTAQDLREMCDDIKNFLKYLDTKMDVAKNIKKVWEQSNVENGKKMLNMENFMGEVLPIMSFRRDMIQVIYELYNLLQYIALYLYFLELASKDEIALKCTERVIKDEKGNWV